MASGLSTQDHLAVLLYLIRSASTALNDMQAAARDCPFGAMEWNGWNGELPDDVRPQMGLDQT